MSNKREEAVAKCPTCLWKHFEPRLVEAEPPAAKLFCLHCDTGMSVENVWTSIKRHLGSKNCNASPRWYPPVTCGWFGRARW